MQPFLFKDSIVPWMGKTSKFMDYYLTDGLQEKGINLSKEQLLILVFMKKKPDCNQNQLAYFTNRSKTALTRILQTLEKKNYIYRSVNHSDKRINHVHLTDLGRDMLEQAIPVVRSLIEEAQDGIEKHKIATAIEVMQELMNNLNKRNPKLNLGQTP